MQRSDGVAKPKRRKIVVAGKSRRPNGQRSDVPEMSRKDLRKSERQHASKS